MSGAALQEAAVPLGVRRLEGDEERRVGHDWRVLLAVRVGDDPSLGLTSSSSDVCCLPGATFLTVFLLQLRARWWLHLRELDGEALNAKPPARRLWA